MTDATNERRAVSVEEVEAAARAIARPQAEFYMMIYGRAGHEPSIQKLVDNTWPDFAARARIALEAAAQARPATDADLAGEQLSIADYEEVLADKRRLTRDLDLAMHGEDGAAKQASLCDLIEPARRLRDRATATEAANARLREVLRLCEWASVDDFDAEFCPVCEGYRHEKGHTPDCGLALALRDTAPSQNDPKRGEIDPGADRAEVRRAALEEAAKLLDPKGPRPCGCDHCDCGNPGDHAYVCAWDEAKANATAIRALATRSQP